MTIITQVVISVVLMLGMLIIFKQLTGQLGVIHDLVNSNLSKVQADLKIALERISSLEKYISHEEGKEEK